MPTHQASNFATRFTGFMKPVNLNSIVQHELIILHSHSNSGSYRRCTWFENLGGAETPEDALKAAEAQCKRIFAKWKEKGKI